MTAPTLKDFYDARTKIGADWSVISDDGYTVIGQTLYQDTWRDVTWIRDAKGNLFSQDGRAWDIQRRYPIVEIQAPLDRALDTPFVVSASRVAKVTYTVSLYATLSLSGTSYARVTLLVDDQRVAARAMNRITALLAILTSYEPEKEQIVTATVPAGSTVELRSDTSGSGTATLLLSEEILV